MALPSPVGSSCIAYSSSSCPLTRTRCLICASIPARQNRGLRLSVVRSVGVAQLRPRASVRLDRILTSDEADEIGDGFFEAVEELERMVREPSDVLGDMVERLSARELQLVLVYFAQEGRDAYCALEVFDWLRRENRVDGETMELMVSIACGWIERLIEEDRAVEDVVGLLNEIDCVGLEPGFSMVEKAISLYWDSGKEEEAVEFVKDVLKRKRFGNPVTREDGRGGLVGYLAWKMMANGRYLDAVKVVIDFRESGLKPELYSYIVALTALVKEQKEFSKTLRRLKGSIKSGLIEELDSENLGLVEQYQSDLLTNGIRLAELAVQEGSSRILGIVHERLLALYTCAGCGLKAERQLWEMKLSGKQPDRELYDIILAICASQNEEGAVSRLLTGMELMGAGPGKKTLLWLLRGYLKGGHYVKAAETLSKMLDLGISPAYLDRAAVLPLGRLPLFHFSSLLRSSDRLYPPLRYCSWRHLLSSRVTRSPGALLVSSRCCSSQGCATPLQSVPGYSDCCVAPAAHHRRHVKRFPGCPLLHLEYYFARSVSIFLEHAGRRAISSEQHST